MNSQNEDSRAIYALFIKDDKFSEDASASIYTLVSKDNAFEVYERMPLESKLKDYVGKIEYSNIQQLSIECLFDIIHITPLIKHIYDSDPTGNFFDRDASIILRIKTYDNKNYKYALKGVRMIIPVLLDIAKQNKIDIVESINGYIDDICTLSNIELYKKYIQPKINYTTHIKNY